MKTVKFFGPSFRSTFRIRVQRFVCGVKQEVRRARPIVWRHTKRLCSGAGWWTLRRRSLRKSHCLGLRLNDYVCARLLRLSRLNTSCRPTTSQLHRAKCYTFLFVKPCVGFRAQVIRSFFNFDFLMNCAVYVRPSVSPSDRPSCVTHALVLC